MSDTELDDFKTRIDLREYAAQAGYTLDRRDSSRASSVMRNSAGDKLIVKRAPNGHFIYFSVRDDADNGSIIDFIAHRRRLNLGQIRRELRPWIGRPASPALPRFAPLVVAPKDRAAVEREYSRTTGEHHDYLIGERRIPAELLASPRFAGRVRADDRGNAVFPHFDASGLCGFEKKNRDFTGFATGGSKGLWESHDLPDDARLVFAESAIDALSYATLFHDAGARYRSFGGQVNDRQPELIRAAVLALPDGGAVIAAMDNDDAGRKLAGFVEQAVFQVGRPSLTFRSHLPENSGTDWNDVLKGSFPIALSISAFHP